MSKDTTTELRRVTIGLHDTIRLWSEYGGPALPTAVEEAMRAASDVLLRDTDGSPEGPDRNGLDGEAATAGAAESGIAQTHPSSPSNPEQQS